MSDADETRKDSAASSIDTAAVLAHLVAVLPGGECAPATAIRHLEGTLRWREEVALVRERGRHAQTAVRTTGSVAALAQAVCTR